MEYEYEALFKIKVENWRKKGMEEEEMWEDDNHISIILDKTNYPNPET